MKRKRKENERKEGQKKKVSKRHRDAIVMRAGSQQLG